MNTHTENRLQIYVNPYNIVGIDISKEKSMVAILRVLREVVEKPFEVNNNKTTLKNFVKLIKSISSETRVVMECTRK